MMLEDLRKRHPNGDVVMISVQNAYYNMVGGTVMELPLENAAVALVEGTHRLASTEEIKVFREQQTEAAKAAKAAEAAKSTFLVSPSVKGFRK